ncbi:hypothetical protein LTR84_002119 [Exophiala bonariae]|uniref:Fe2OG dioxygenase domain-containing protein n=1 Tax=Exophiala bonariae TaxID=1690606 RepID=A0AAV9NAN3_9EURO|nr:hypothetical protein LTR84_002119 [Exophiala bonariae]
MALPVIDFGPFLDASSSSFQKKQVAFEIDKACREVGFFYLKNHGVPAELVADMLAKTRHVFETATPEEKERLAMRGSAEGGDSARGWLKVKNAAGAHEVSATTPTFKAVDFFRPVPVQEAPYTTGMGPNLWPSVPADFRTTAETYIDQLENLGNSVMKAIAIGLSVDESIFLDRIDKAFWNLRILGYEGRKTRSESAAGIGEHTGKALDHPYSCKKSLQVLSKTGEWIWADPIEGCYVCNIGDMLSEWTRGAYKSTLHRVCHNSDSLRISIPFFFDPNWDAFISPVLPSAEGTIDASEGIRYQDKFIKSIDYPLWRDPPSSVVQAA